KQELFNAVWPGTFVGDAVLKASILELRDALEDDAKKPRFIETVHRRGYRFIGKITERRPMSESPRHRSSDRRTWSTSAIGSVSSPTGIVGRDEALSKMRSSFEKIRQGERQIVFVTGEAGIGKTTLVDAFVQNICVDQDILVGRGQCLEHFSASE